MYDLDDDEWDDYWGDEDDWMDASVDVGECCVESECLEGADASCKGCGSGLCGAHWVATNGYCGGCLRAPAGMRI
jgi:hypothetical protein